jgi:hypothetical protein
MRPTDKFVLARGKLLRASLTITLPILLAMLACGLPASRDVGAPQQATGIALGIKQTFVALTVAAQQAAAATPAPAQLPATETPLAQQNPPTPTIPPVTDTQAASPTPEATATATPPPVLDKISLTEWEMQYWVILPSGCRTSGMPCWKTDDDYNKHFGNSDMVLISKKPVLIDPTWGNPYLVFYYECKLRRTGQIDIQAGSKWSTVRVMTRKTTGGSFVRDEINLRDFKGKEIIIRFAAQGKTTSAWNEYGSHWFVTEMYIYPNYQP